MLHGISSITPEAIIHNRLAESGSPTVPKIHR